MTRRKVFITGAASGIGKATAQRFAAEGCDILANDIQHGKLTELIKSLPKGDHLVLEGSYADQQTINVGKQLIKERWGTIDVLVSCAGLFQKTDPVNMEIAEWRKVFDTMVNGSVLISQLAASFMVTAGRIVHITSIHGTHAELSASSYSMAKAAINQLCRSLAIELADKNILVNAIAPGFVNTAMSVVNGENELESEWFKLNYINSHHLPLRRAAQPEEIAGVAYFLAGPDATYITGQVITVDGGLTITF
jgi:NAD(P)-dependent dehydrogenase (short-subunit alcohol dehydrogenase family)